MGRLICFPLPCFNTPREDWARGDSCVFWMMMHFLFRNFSRSIIGVTQTVVFLLPHRCTTSHFLCTLHHKHQETLKVEDPDMLKSKLVWYNQYLVFAQTLMVPVIYSLGNEQPLNHNILLLLLLGRLFSFSVIHLLWCKIWGGTTVSN